MQSKKNESECNKSHMQDTYAVHTWFNMIAHPTCIILTAIQMRISIMFIMIFGPMVPPLIPVNHTCRDYLVGYTVHPIKCE